nr:hypothetical transcript [Hymenolepis microstoma]
MVESTEPNCQQSAAIVSPVKEVDTKLLQTDAQEFYEEIPAHSDDFNSIPGDIHNFLTKHPTISTKKRNKRKRKKIAKPIAADHQNISKLFIQNRSPKYKLLLWRLASRRPRLIHGYSSLDSKNPNFTKKDRVQPPVLHKLLTRVFTKNRSPPILHLQQLSPPVHQYAGLPQQKHHS